MWPQDVCQELKIVQANRIARLRGHYENCLLHFRAYVESGQYAAELDHGRAPSLENVQPYTPSPETEAVVARVDAVLAARVNQATPAGGTRVTAAGVAHVGASEGTHVTAGGATRVLDGGGTQGAGF